MVKIVYLIASHVNPEQVIRMVKTLKTGNSESWVVIRHDYSVSYLDPSAFTEMKNVYILKDSISVEWGDYSFIKMVLNSIDWISNNLDYDWLVFISGQDYPIQPMNRIEQYFEQTEYDGFINGNSVNDLNKYDDIYNRYFFQYFKLPHYFKNFVRKVSFVNRFQSLVRIVPGIPGIKPRIGFRSFTTPYTPYFKCYKGSTSFNFSKKCVNIIIRFICENPMYLEYYKKCFVPEESFFLTILFNDSNLKILNDDLRYTSWNNPQYGFAHPDVLGIRNIDQIMLSNKLFARKFDINIDAQILDMLDQIIINDKFL